MSDSPDLKAVAARIGRVTSEMHGEIVQARMTPVWQVFDRFPGWCGTFRGSWASGSRSRSREKRSRLDRAILDEIGDPLIHLLRNAVDHGIESTAERKKRNKPAEGRILLRAIRDRTSVAIRVKDDGQGIDRQKVLAKAVKEGHVRFRHHDPDRRPAAPRAGPPGLQHRALGYRRVGPRGRDGCRAVQGSGAGRLGRAGNGRG